MKRKTFSFAPNYKTDVQNCLNEMSAVGLIEQMREATPFQVVRRWNDKLGLLKRAYESEAE